MRDTLTRRGLRLEYATLGWNLIGVPVLVVAAIRSGSAAAAGFGFDSAIEIGASLVVVWQLTGAPKEREALGLRLIGYTFGSRSRCTSPCKRPTHSLVAIIPGTRHSGSSGRRRHAL